MIRQAISCDICAAEKRQTNHWFVAYEQGGELRVSGWNSRQRLRPGSKHLCGQTCLHKLVDEFMAKSISVRARRTAESAEAEPQPRQASDTSLIAGSAFAEGESSARLIAPPKPCRPVAPLRRPFPSSSPVPSLSWSPCRHGRFSRTPLLFPTRPRVTPRATGAPKPGSGNANASCAPSRIVPTLPHAAVARMLDCLSFPGSPKGMRYVVRSRLGSCRPASTPRYRAEPRPETLAYWRLARISHRRIADCGDDG